MNKPNATPRPAAARSHVPEGPGSSNLEPGPIGPHPGDPRLDPNDSTPMLPTTPEVVAVLVANHRRILAFHEKRVGPREVAEDILQDAFVRGLPRAAQLRDEESVIAWIYRSLRTRSSITGASGAPSNARCSICSSPTSPRPSPRRPGRRERQGVRRSERDQRE